jgi:hypothetical protein
VEEIQVSIDYTSFQHILVKPTFNGYRTIRPGQFNPTEYSPPRQFAPRKYSPTYNSSLGLLHLSWGELSEGNVGGRIVRTPLSTVHSNLEVVGLFKSGLVMSLYS